MGCRHDANMVIDHRHQSSSCGLKDLGAQYAKAPLQQPLFLWILFDCFRRRTLTDGDLMRFSDDFAQQRVVSLDRAMVLSSFKHLNFALMYYGLFVGIDVPEHDPNVSS